jgi:hypothetical protein
MQPLKYIIVNYSILLFSIFLNFRYLCLFRSLLYGLDRYSSYGCFCTEATWEDDGREYGWFHHWPRYAVWGRIGLFWQQEIELAAHWREVCEIMHATSVTVELWEKSGFKEQTVWLFRSRLAIPLISRASWRTLARYGLKRILGTFIPGTSTSSSSCTSSLSFDGMNFDYYYYYYYYYSHYWFFIFMHRFGTLLVLKNEGSESTNYHHNQTDERVGTNGGLGHNEIEDLLMWGAASSVLEDTDLVKSEIEPYLQERMRRLLLLFIIIIIILLIYLYMCIYLFVCLFVCLLI